MIDDAAGAIAGELARDYLGVGELAAHAAASAMVRAVHARLAAISGAPVAIHVAVLAARDHAGPAVARALAVRGDARTPARAAVL
jgi:hypothetical protein